MPNNPTGSAVSHAPVTSPATYTTPILALLNGQPVRITATGNQEGKSPVLQYVGPDRVMRWESSDQFQIIDLNYLPPTIEQLQAMGQESRFRS